MLDLLDYRQQVFSLYSHIRQHGSHQPDMHTHWIEKRDKLFADHPQSALQDQHKAMFSGLSYWDYDPNFRMIAQLNTNVPATEYQISAGDDGTVTIRQIGKVDFEVATGSGSLGVFWIGGYGGGIFIPFKDLTNGRRTYGGGRYLYDTIKGADLGIVNRQSLILDFNYSYHPSCYYNPRWVCPLAPAQNQLSIAINAGEQLIKFT